ncbi:Hypothetical protein PBC10988_9670 [Planctomycetales bacterium 10988]|nr:Hypothetical protein PBC10988_9670 [Planctomycetales bacterium 10988]
MDYEETSNSGSQNGLYWRLVPLGIAVLLLILGYRDISEGFSNPLEPVPVPLSNIEQNGPPKETYLQFEQHLALFTGAVYAGEKSRFDFSKDDSRLKLDYVYYPVISTEHPFLLELDELLEEYGSWDQIPDHALPRQIEPIAVLVRSYEYKRVREIPDGIVLQDSLVGVIESRKSLDSEEKKLLSEGFPGIDFDQCLIFTLRDKPPPIAFGVLMFGTGIIFLLIGSILMAHYLLTR